MKKNRLGGLSGHTHLGGVAGVGFVEERPDTRLDSLPAGQLTAVKLLVQSKPQPLVTPSCPSSQPYTAAPGPAGRAHTLPPDPLVAPGGGGVSLVQSELLHNVLVGRPVGVQVQPVK